MKEKNINQLIADHLWGTASEKDNQRLTELLSENSELRQRFDQLLNNKELAERYRQYATINPTDKLQVISDKCESSLGGDSSSEGKQTSHFSLLTSGYEQQQSLSASLLSVHYGLLTTAAPRHQNFPMR